MSHAEAMRGFRAQRRNRMLHGMLMLFVVGLCGYMIRDLLDDLRYDLGSQPRLDLGRVEGADIAGQIGEGDRYVQLTGIIGNRGAVVSGGRVSSLLNPERWYRQLVGNPLVLEIEVGDDEVKRERYQMFTEVTVEGRARFIQRNHNEYESIITFFKQRFGYDLPAHAIIVTVDRVPGKQKKSLIVVIFIAGVALLYVFLIVFFVLRRKPLVQADAEPE